MQLEFYADLRDDSQSPSSNYGVDNDDIEYKQSPNSMEDTSNHIIYLEETMDTETSDSGEQKPEEQPELDEYIEAYKEKLDDITNDMLLRLETGDGNFISGLNKFIREYGKMKTSLCPTPVIAHSLHMFGKNDSKLYSIIMIGVRLSFMWLHVCIQSAIDSTKRQCSILRQVSLYGGSF